MTQAPLGIPAPAGGATSTLLVVATPLEALAVWSARRGGPFRAASVWRLVEIDDGLDLLLSGVGKANAAGAVATVLDSARHRAVLNLGVAGALPVEGAPSPGELILATRSVLADEGVQTPGSFEDVASMGFPPGPADHAAIGAPGDAGLIEALAPRADGAGVIATVSTCSGTDALALEIVRRTGAVAEAMEGAAIAFTLLNLAARDRTDPVPFLEARAISNTTGERARQVWRLQGALDRLAAFAGAL